MEQCGNAYNGDDDLIRSRNHKEITSVATSQTEEEK